MSEANGLEGGPKKKTDLRHFGGWVLTTAAAAGTYFVADPNFSSEVENTLIILGGGAAVSMLSLWTGLRSPLIALRYSKNALGAAVRAARGKRQSPSEPPSIIDTE